MSWKVYVIHFDKPYKHAKHYTGIALNVNKRMKEHKGGYGSKLMKVITENNIGFRYNIIAEYPNYSRAKTEEKRLKIKDVNINFINIIMKKFVFIVKG